MIWTTWRQHRAEMGVSAGILAVLVAAMTIVGSIARSRAHSLGLPSCTATHGDCSAALESLHRDFHTIPPFTATLVALPLLAGLFLAAPLVSREYETGTHRLAWTQSVTARRWLTTKMLLIVSVFAVGALAVGLTTTWALAPLRAAFGGRYNSTWYDIQGLVPVACMIFALCAGIAVSALVGRTIPAMAVTLGAYAAARIPVHWFRSSFWPAATAHHTVPISTLLANPDAPVQFDFAAGGSPQDWIHSTTITGPSGLSVSADRSNIDVLGHYCPGIVTRPAAGTSGAISGSAPPRPSADQLAACRPRLAGLSLRETVIYQPAGHFWYIQAVESALFIGIAGVLGAIAVLAVTRYRRT